MGRRLLTRSEFPSAVYQSNISGFLIYSWIKRQLSVNENLFHGHWKRASLSGDLVTIRVTYSGQSSQILLERANASLDV